jgi:hypothetical protein
LDRSVEGACSEISIILPMSYAEAGTYVGSWCQGDGQYIESKKLLKLVGEHEHFTFYTSIKDLPKNTFGKSMANVCTGVFNISGIIDVCEGSASLQLPQVPETLPEKKPTTPIVTPIKKERKLTLQQAGLFL